MLHGRIVSRCQTQNRWRRDEEVGDEDSSRVLKSRIYRSIQYLKGSFDYGWKFDCCCGYSEAHPSVGCVDPEYNTANSERGGLGARRCVYVCVCVT